MMAAPVLLPVLLPVLFYVWAALLGLIFGSFASLAAHRLPLGLPIAAGHSRCPHCEHRLHMADLVPVISYVWNRGKCRYCAADIAWRYPLIEIVTALLFVLALAVAGPGMMALALGLLAAGLIIMTVIDLEYQIIPDQISLTLAGLGIAYHLMAGGGVDRWLSAGAGGLAGFLIAWALRAVFQRLKGREALGFGDVKFFAVAGLWTGIAGLADFMMLSGLAGILFAAGWRLRGGDVVFPFGPALAIGLFGVMLLHAGGIAQPLSLLIMQ